MKRRAMQRAKTMLYVHRELVEPAKSPLVATGLHQPRAVPEASPRAPRGFVGIQSLRAFALGAQFHVQAHLLGQFGGDAVTAKEEPETTRQFDERHGCLRRV